MSEVEAQVAGGHARRRGWWWLLWGAGALFVGARVAIAVDGINRLGDDNGGLVFDLLMIAIVFTVAIVVLTLRVAHAPLRRIASRLAPRAEGGVVMVSLIDPEHLPFVRSILAGEELGGWPWGAGFIFSPGEFSMWRLDGRGVRRIFRRDSSDVSFSTMQVASPIGRLATLEVRVAEGVFRLHPTDESSWWRSPRLTQARIDQLLREVNEAEEA